MMDRVVAWVVMERLDLCEGQLLEFQQRCCFPIGLRRPDRCPIAFPWLFCLPCLADRLGEAIAWFVWFGSLRGLTEGGMDPRAQG